MTEAQTIFLAWYPFTAFLHLHYLITTKEALKASCFAQAKQIKLFILFIPLFISLLIIPTYWFVFNLFFGTGSGT